MSCLFDEDSRSRCISALPACDYPWASGYVSVLEAAISSYLPAVEGGKIKEITRCIREIETTHEDMKAKAYI